MEEKDYSPLFPHLDKVELRLLCFLAYAYSDKNQTLQSAGYKRRFKISQNTYDEQLESLRTKGYLLGKTYVNPDWHLRVLMYLQDNQTDWVASFRDLDGRIRSHISQYLWDLATLVHRGDFKAAAALRRPYIGVSYELLNLGRYVRKLALDDARYLSLLNQKECRIMCSDLLYDLFCRYELDESAITSLSEVLPKEISLCQDYKDEIEGYRFLMTGNCHMSDSGTPWSYSVQAIRQAYAGNFSEAFDLFQKVSNICGKKDMIGNPILDYFYGLVMCILRKRGVREGIEPAWNRFRMSSELTFTNKNAAICTLVHYHDQYGELTQRYLLEKIQMRQKEDHSPLTCALSYLIANYFGIDEQQWNDLGIEASMPPYAILQHELSAYLPLGPHAKEELIQKYGGRPLLTNLRREEPWERALRFVGEEIEVEKNRKDSHHRRLAWFIKGFRITNPVEQIQHDDGSWHNGSRFSLVKLKNADLDYLDALDNQLVHELLEKPNNITDIDIAIPLLANSGRLFYGDGSEDNLQPVEVVSEAPFLSAQGQGKEIVLSSNVPLDSRGSVPRCIVSCVGTAKYSIIRVNALQRDILCRMLAQRTFPVSALKALSKSLENMKGIIEVRENLSEGLLNPTYSGSGILSVRISPKGNQYNVELLATAMPNGIFRDLPGDGERRIYDEVDGLTHCVERDLEKENENYGLISDYLKEECCAEFSCYNQAEVYTPEGLLHLLSYIYDNQNRYFAEWPEGVSLKFKGNISEKEVDVQVQTEEKWFKVEGVVRFGGKTLTLEEMLEAYCSSDIRGFIKLEEGQYYKLSDALRRHLSMLDALPSASKKAKAIPQFEVGALAQSLAGLRCHSDGGYERQLDRMKSSFALDPAVPEGITAKLRDYQLEGYRWMCRLDAWGAGCCLADDMGLGKTLQALAFLLGKAEKGPSLVVAPKSVIPNWAQEAYRFAPQLKVCILNNESRRKESIHKAGEYDLVLCTYGVLVTESSELAKRRWNVICLDEAHQIKNRLSQASMAAMRLKSDSRIILTGTPLQNHIGELWNLFQFINPGLLGPWQLFKDSYSLPTPDEEHMQMLKELTQPFILRRTKEEVLDELPDKDIIVRTVTMSEPEARVYEEMRRLVELKFKKDKSKSERAEVQELKLSFFEELTKLRLISCSMKLVYPEWKEQSTKITALMELLDSLLEEPENRCIVFSQFTSFLAMIKPELKKRGMEFLYMDGQTELEKRQEMVEQFQRRECQLFVSSLKAGGLGINLTAANYVILLDPWWNPAIENQAMDRAHRLGQQRNVTVVRLVAGQTIEEKILRLHEKKQNLSDEILADTGESYKLTYEDILDMVAPF